MASHVQGASTPFAPAEADSNTIDQRPTETETETPRLPSSYTVFPPCGFNEFRLLELHCGNESDPLIGTLRTHLLEASPLYSAVSHTWGEELESPTDGHAIVLNGDRCPIKRNNLFSMLRDLRDPAMPRMLWIDAICIDQSNVPERNAQVSNMANIYSNADCVVIWLSGLLESRFSKDDREYAKDILDRMRKDRGYANDILDRMRKNDYWTRTWIIQEVILARRAEIQNRELCRPVELLFNEKGVTAASPRNSPEGFLFNLHAGRLKRRDKMPDTDFRTLLLRHSYSKCMDPRDKIFALLSLNQQAGAHIPVDYNMSAMSLFLVVMNFLARVERVEPRDLIALGVSLRQQLRISKSDVRAEIQKQAGCQGKDDILFGLETRIYLRGYADPMVSLQGEDLVPDCRRKARHLATYPAMHFHSRPQERNAASHNSAVEEVGTIRDQVAVGTHSSPLEYVLVSELTSDIQPPNMSTRDYYVFGTTKPGRNHATTDNLAMIGMAPMRLTKDHQIWQFAGTTVACVGSSESDHLQLFGRAYLASPADDDDDAPFGWDTLTIDPERPLPPSVRRNSRKLRLTSPLFLALVMWADDGD